RAGCRRRPGRAAWHCARRGRLRAGWEKRRLAVRIRRRPDRNWGKGQVTPTRGETAGPRSGRRSLARGEGKRKGSEAPRPRGLRCGQTNLSEDEIWGAPKAKSVIYPEDRVPDGPGG